VPNVAFGFIFGPGIEQAGDNFLRRRVLLQVPRIRGKRLWGEGPARISGRMPGQDADGVGALSLGLEPVSKAGKVLPGHINHLAAWSPGMHRRCVPDREDATLDPSRRYLNLEEYESIPVDIENGEVGGIPIARR
jgi:hypothetical protein